MKKLITLAAALSLALVCFAQTPTQYQPPASSLLSDKTAGLFENQFDKQFSANPDFGSYDQQFLYGGLGNPRKEGAMLNGNVAGIKNIMLGYYRPAAKPWSIFGSWGADGSFSHQGSWKQEIGGVKTEFTPLGAFLFKNYETHLQFLTGLGGEKNIVVGGQFFMYSDFSQLVPANFSKTKVEGGIAAETVELWNMANVSATPNAATNNFEIGMPLSFTKGAAEHSARIFVNSNITNKDGSYKNTPASGSKQEVKITDVQAYTKVGAKYEVSLPVRDREEDSWILGGNFNIGFAGANYKKEVEGPVPAAVKKGEKKYKTTVGGGFMLEGQRLFNFNIADSANFKIRPGVGFGYNGAHNSANAKKAEAYLTKNVDGATETNYEDPKQWKSAHEVVTKFELPMGITVKPEKWVCGFMLGATPSVELTADVKYDEVMLDTGKIGSRTVAFKPEFKEEHVVGLTFDFAGGVHIDVYATGNLTELNKYTAQVFIPLGQPKAKAPKAKKGAEKTEAAKKN